jgi:hypothetical protein
MRASPTSAVLFAAFGLFATATITAAAQAGGKPLFTDRPWLCAGGGRSTPNDPNDR